MARFEQVLASIQIECKLTSNLGAHILWFVCGMHIYVLATMSKYLLVLHCKTNVDVLNLCHSALQTTFNSTVSVDIPTTSLHFFEV